MENKKFEDFAIDEEMVQWEAASIIERELSAEELDQVHEAMYDKFYRISEFLQEIISEVVGFNELMERNKGADVENPRYEVFWRNQNAYQKDFKKEYSFKSLEDAKEYINSELRTEFDHWKVVLVNGTSESEVHKVN